MNTNFSHDVYSRFKSTLHIQSVFPVFTIPLAAMVLFLLSPHSANIHTDWFSLFLASVAWGTGITAAIQLLTGLWFLRPRIKNHPPQVTYQYPICHALRITQHRLIALAVCIGLLVMFTHFTFLSSSEPIDFSIFFGDLLVGIIGSVLIGLWSALMLDGMISAFIGKSLVFKFKRSHAAYLSHKNSAHRHLYSNPHSSLRNDWYNDVTNPASPVHQATYRHADHPHS